MEARNASVAEQRQALDNALSIVGRKWRVEVPSPRLVVTETDDIKALSVSRSTSTALVVKVWQVT